MYLDRGWFESEGHDDILFSPPNDEIYQGLKVINPPLDIERPVRSTDDLVNYITTEIAVRPPPHKIKGQNEEYSQKVYLVVDSITSLLKDAAGPGEERRQTFELIQRLRSLFSNGDPHSQAGDQVALMFLMSENTGLLSQDPKDEKMFTPRIKVEDYVADYVIQLDTKLFPLGHRMRVLEFLKSQGSHIMLGQHSWMILTHSKKRKNPPFSRVVVGESLRSKIVASTMAINRSPNQPDTQAPYSASGTIVVARRPYVSAGEYKPNYTSEKHRENSLWSGMPGLDEMLSQNCGPRGRTSFDYWISPAGNDSTVKNNFSYYAETEYKGSITEGSTTLLVGEPGSGKTSLTLPYLFASSILELSKINEESLAEKSYGWEKFIGLIDEVIEQMKSVRRFFISFENDPLKQIVTYLTAVFREMALPHGLDVDLSIVKLRKDEIGDAAGSSSSVELEELSLEINFSFPGGPPEDFEDEEKLKFSTSLQELGEFMYRPRNLLDFNLLLLEARTWLEQSHQDSPSLDRRVVIDGMSDLLSSYDRLAVTQMFDALLETFRTFDNRMQPLKSGPPLAKTTVFVTYEDSQENLSSDSDAFRLPVDNLLLLKRIDVNDRQRHLIQVIQSSQKPSDSVPRELIINASEPFQSRVFGGFNEFNGLNSKLGNYGPVRINIDAFAENKFQRAFNKSGLKHLRHKYPYNFQLRNLFRDDIVKLTRNRGDSAPDFDQPREPLDLKIRVLDDWCRGTTNIDRSLGTLAFWDILKDENRRVSIDWNRHVGFSEDRATLYIDHGFFAFHSKLFRIHADSEEALDPKREAYFLLMKLIDDSRAGKLTAGGPTSFRREFTLLDRQPSPLSTPEDGDDEKPTPSITRYRDLYFHISKLPWVSGLEVDQWEKDMKIKKIRSLFDCKTIVGLLAYVRSLRSKDDLRAEVAFDLETPAVAAAFFMELVLAFGGSSESIMAESNTDSLRTAAEFIAFMSKEEFFSDLPSIDASGESLFSRHFYASFQSVNCPNTAEEVSGEDEVLTRPDHRVSTSNSLILLPHVPISYQRGESENRISYCCSGNWSVGYDKTGVSAGLGPKIMATMLSSAADKSRAAFGAGIPAGKEFYDFHGAFSVTGAPYLSWNEVASGSSKRFETSAKMFTRRQMCPDSSAPEKCFLQIRDAMKALIVQAKAEDCEREEIIRLFMKSLVILG
ncbi:hypothetical protein N9891_01540 [bacterium]|nr:hypothetical protein [bacterium]